MSKYISTKVSPISILPHDPSASIDPPISKSREAHTAAALQIMDTPDQSKITGDVFGVVDAAEAYRMWIKNVHKQLDPGTNDFNKERSLMFSIKEAWKRRTFYPGS
jgi:hypothetical protein